MRISFSAGVIYNKKLYFSDDAINGLFETNLSNGNTNYIGIFPNESRFKELLHSCALIWNDKIVFVPNQGSNIHIFDLETRNITHRRVYRSSNSRYIFNGGYINNDTLYIFSKCIDQPILKINLNDHYEQRIVLDNKLEIEGIALDESFTKVYVKGNRACFAAMSNNTIIFYDFETDELEQEETDISKITGIYELKNGIWITELGSKVYRYNPEKKVIHKMDINCKRYPSLNMFLGIESLNGTYLVPDLGGEVIFIGKDKKDINKYQYIGEINKNNKSRRMSFFYEGWAYDSETLILFPPKGEDLVLIKNGKVSNLRLRIVNLKKLYKEHQIKDSMLMSEGAKYSMEDFLGMVD